MELSHEFVVQLPIEEAWTVLTDLGRVVPCMPGAQIDEMVDDEYRGKVRVKVGPITAEYKGAAHFLRRDQLSHVAELRAEGRETRGQGAAAATVRATLSEQTPGQTSVEVQTTLDITGRVAQFGRGALAEVSSKLLGQFVDNLERDLAEQAASEPQPDAAATGEPTPASGETPATSESAGAAETPPVRVLPAATPPAEPVRMLGIIGPVLLKRLSPVAALIALVAVIRRRRRRRHGSAA